MPDPVRLRRAACLLAFVLAISISAVARAGGARFEVTLPEGSPALGAGRVVVFLVREGSRVWDRDPADGPFWDDPQPLFGIDIGGLEPGASVTIDPGMDFPDAFPHPPARLEPGRYKAQAIFDGTRTESAWRREAGNRFGEVVTFEIGEGEEPTLVRLSLERRTEAFEFPAHESLREISIESKLLSDFRRAHHGDDAPVKLNAGVVLPIDYDPTKKYAAVYEIPGFGGRHDEAAGHVFRRGGDWSELRRRAFIIVLDPESPNGHTLFCDSRVNGPVGEALIEELVPAIEKEFPLITEPWARIVTGHSSGGWSSLWLGVTYPDTFGAVWSTAPDPVDFRRFELIDIYSHENAYTDEQDQERPAARFPAQRRQRGDRGEQQRTPGYYVTMTVREENGGEGVLGPHNTSGQQWDSWMACWGNPDSQNPRVAKPLFDAQTGALDHAEAKAYEAYDIRLLLSRHPDRYGPIFANNVRLICGEMDNYYLNEAVSLLKEELAKHELPEGPGYITLVPGADHGLSLYMSPAMRAIPREMVEHLDDHQQR